MLAKGWVLLALQNQDHVKEWKKLLLPLNFLSSQIQTLEEGKTLLQRRSFVLAVIDPSFLPLFQFQTLHTYPTYVVLLISKKPNAKIQSWLFKNWIQDWVEPPFSSFSVHRILHQALQYRKRVAEKHGPFSQSISFPLEKTFSIQWGKNLNLWVKKIKNLHVPLALLGKKGSKLVELTKLIHLSSKRWASPCVVLSISDHTDEQWLKILWGEIPTKILPKDFKPSPGLFSWIGDGTLILEKSECLSKDLQKRLAKVLSQKSFSPVGGGNPLVFQGRLIFLFETPLQKWSSIHLHKDLLAWIKKHSFFVSPLKNRKKDLKDLFQWVLQNQPQKKGEPPKKLSPKAIKTLEDQPWERNLEELDEVLSQALKTSPSTMIEDSSLFPILRSPPSSSNPTNPGLENLFRDHLLQLFHRYGVEAFSNLHPLVMEKIERPLFSLVLQWTKGNQMRAAKLLGINRNTLRKKISLYQIPSYGEERQPKLFPDNQKPSSQNEYIPKEKPI